MKIVSKALIVALTGLLASCATNEDSISGPLPEAQEFNIYAYADARRLGRVFKIVEKSHGRSYWIEDGALLAEHCDTDRFHCFNTNLRGLEFAVPREEINIGDTWKDGDTAYSAVGGTHLLWQARGKHFFLI
jgi:hypothetical protein